MVVTGNQQNSTAVAVGSCRSDGNFAWSLMLTPALKYRSELGGTATFKFGDVSAALPQKRNRLNEAQSGLEIPTP